MNENKRLPDAFVADMRATLGEEEAERLCDALGGEPEVSVRLNPRKYDKSAATMQRVPWCTNGYYLAERPPFTFDPLFHAGAYYVQEASSMFIEQVVRQHAGSGVQTALDLCAAPGGKSTLLRSLLPDGALLVCNEPMAKRAQVLAENMTKWGDPDVIVTQSMPDAFTPMQDTFSLILADVPCSGEGMFRKDDEAIADWSPENVELCWRRQRNIIEAVWPALMPGGLLIYSTCTFNRYEDEDNVAWIAETLGAEVLTVETRPEWNVAGNGLGYHFYPGRTRGEGFFCAALRKKADITTSLRLGDEIAESGGFTIAKEGNMHYAIRSCHLPLLRQLRLTARVVQAGLVLGEDTRKGFVPSHAIALTTLPLEQLGLDYPRVELPYDEAVAYLRGEALRLSADVPKGIVMVTFRGLGLGFAKNIGSRANNLYPDAWRIRSTYTKPFVLEL